MRQDIGHHHPFPPEPIAEEDTRYVDAGAVRFGVEVRRLDGLAERLQAAYDGTPFEEAYDTWTAERARHRTPGAPTVMGGGVSVHVLDSTSGHEYLRFDCFAGVPHYHYLRTWETPEQCDNHAVDWDEVAHGPMTPWVLTTLRTRLAEMLTEAGAGDLAGRIDPSELSRAVDRVEELIAATS